jgi:hypothetical protein
LARLYGSAGQLGHRTQAMIFALKRDLLSFDEIEVPGLQAW